MLLASSSRDCHVRGRRRQAYVPIARSPAVKSRKVDGSGAVTVIGVESA